MRARRTAEHHRLGMLHGEQLAAQRREHPLRLGGSLLGGQPVQARSAAELVAFAQLPGAMLFRLGIHGDGIDLRPQRRRIDRGQHDVEGDRTSLDLELIGLRPHLAEEGPVRQHRSAEKVQRPAPLHLGRKHVVEESLLVQARDAERPLAARGESGIEVRIEIVADLLTHLLVRGTQIRAGGGEGLIMVQRLADQRVERRAAEGAPPVR